MLTRWSVASAAAILLAGSPALAADNYAIIDGSGAPRSIAAHDTGSALIPQSAPTSFSGLPLFTATNPGLVAFPTGTALTLGAGSATIGGVTQSGAWSFGLSGPIPTGSNVIGAVTQSGTWNVAISNLPATQPVSGAVSVSNFPVTQAVSGTVSVSSLPSLAAGTNAIGSVSVSNLPATQPVSNAGTFAVQNTAPLPAGTNTLGSIANISGTISLPTGAATAANQAAMLANQNVTAAGTSAANAQAVQGVTNGVPMPVSAAPAGITRTRLSCTLPAYATGGNSVCTDASGNQTTNACAANTACLISAPNANRKTAFFMNRTAGTTIDVGYAATVAPGNGVGVDGPGTSGGQGGSLEENPAHVGAYYAASPSASTLVFVQGQ